MLTRTVTTVAETSAPTTPFVRLRGKWLKEHGIEIGGLVYITETPEGILLSANNPNRQTGDLEAVKAQYRALGIETEKRAK